MSAMNDQSRENLSKLLRRFMDASAARAAEQDIQAGERILDVWPAPAPGGRTIALIKARMVVAAPRHRWRVRVFGGSLATAAAIIMIVLVGLLGRGPINGPASSFAAILPAAVWDSDNLAADDPDLVYFTSEIRQIEAQMQALEADEGETGGETPEDLQIELMAIETEFWKG